MLEQLSSTQKSDTVSNVLKWILLFTAISCFAALIWGTVQTYHLAPPLPTQFQNPSQQVVMTSNDVISGKAGFQKADLMDYGSLYGMGSYFGEDYTAQNLVRLAKLVENNLAQEKFHRAFSELDSGQQYETKMTMQKILQQVSLTNSVTTLPSSLALSIIELRSTISHELLTNNFVAGWTKAYSLNAHSAPQVADFLIYSSLTTVARRPDKNYSFTNNWPYEPLVGNTPTNETFMWTWASFCFVFLGIGATLYIYKRYLNWADTAPKEIIFSGFQGLTQSQRNAGKYFFIVALVMLVQILSGTFLAHYYADRNNFYGFNPAAYLPFNFMRDVHIQTPLVWIGLSWISSALFLAPLISGAEARHQGKLVTLLFWIVLFVVAGALIGDYLGIMNVINKHWFWFGNQGLSYVQLGRFWQIGFAVGLLAWSIMIFRGIWPTFEKLKIATKQFWTGKIRMEHLLWASTINVAVVYWFGMIPLTGIEKSFTITDFWRWWVVHLWVEQSFEFFAACVTAYLLMAVGLVSRLLAERTVFLQTILIFLGGVLGTGHHWYWIGTPSLWLSLGSVFSFIEVLPLMLLVLEAIDQKHLIKNSVKFPYRLAYTYIIGAAFWNFVGAGVFGGGLINAPLINYYEHGTFLTLNHAHTALFGAFGLLALGLIYFCLRYAAGDSYKWSDRNGLIAFWLYNIGVVLWIVLNFFPIGWAQLLEVYVHGYAAARSLQFYKTTLFWQWMRTPGDVIFAIGALLMTYDFLIKLKPFFCRKK